MTMEDLMSLLEVHGIDPRDLAWGTGDAKLPEKLLEEVHRGESELVSIPNGDGTNRLVRRINVALIDVYFDTRSRGRLALVETDHVRNLNSARSPHTFASPASFIDRKMNATLSEKVCAGETAREGALRGKWEELRLDQAPDAEDLASFIDISVGEAFERPIGDACFTKEDAAGLLALLNEPCCPPWRIQPMKYVRAYPSTSYPGLWTESKAHWFMCLLTRRHFGIGYEDRDDSKLTIYKWFETATTSCRVSGTTSPR